MSVECERMHHNVKLKEPHFKISISLFHFVLFSRGTSCIHNLRVHRSTIATVLGMRDTESSCLYNC